MYGQVQNEQVNERKTYWKEITLWKVEKLNIVQNDNAISWR